MDGAFTSSGRGKRKAWLGVLASPACIRISNQSMSCLYCQLTISHATWHQPCPLTSFVNRQLVRKYSQEGNHPRDMHMLAFHMSGFQHRLKHGFMGGEAGDVIGSPGGRVSCIEQSCRREGVHRFRPGLGVLTSYCTCATTQRCNSCLFSLVAVR